MFSTCSWSFAFRVVRPKHDGHSYPFRRDPSSPYLASRPVIHKSPARFHFPLPCHRHYYLRHYHHHHHCHHRHHHPTLSWSWSFWASLTLPPLLLLLHHFGLSLLINHHCWPFRLRTSDRFEANEKSPENLNCISCSLKCNYSEWSVVSFVGPSPNPNQKQD